MKIRFLLRLFAVFGLVLCARPLLPTGCGEGSECRAALESSWSQVLHVPVIVLGVVSYAVLLAATWKPSRPLFAGLAVVLTGASFWFSGLLAAEVRVFCAWCLLLHLTGLCCAILLWQFLKKSRTLRGSGRAGALAGGVALAVLIVAQLLDA